MNGMFGIGNDRSSIAAILVFQDVPGPGTPPAADRRGSGGAPRDPTGFP